MFVRSRRGIQQIFHQVRIWSKVISLWIATHKSRRMRGQSKKCLVVRYSSKLGRFRRQSMNLALQSKYRLAGKGSLGSRKSGEQLSNTNQSWAHADDIPHPSLVIGVFNWLPTKSKGDTWSFYSGKPCTNRDSYKANSENVRPPPTSFPILECIRR